MAEAARFDRLRECFEEHLVETEAQIERLNECFSLLGETARAKPCKGMMGLVEEGQEVMKEGARHFCRGEPRENSDQYPLVLGEEVRMALSAPSSSSS